MFFTSYRSDPETASGIRKILNWVNRHYPGKEMYIAGYLGRPTTGRNSLEDSENVMWYQTHINQVLKGNSIRLMRLTFWIREFPIRIFLRVWCFLLYFFKIETCLSSFLK